MKKPIVAVTVIALSAVGAVALRRYGPGLAERSMQKCHEIMGRMVAQGSAESAPPGGG